MLNRVGIVGSGNVGSALLMQLAATATDLVGDVTITARDQMRAQAAVMDVGSAFPSEAQRFNGADGLTGEFDLVIVTAGGLPGSSDTLLDVNEQIARSSLESCETKTLVVIGTPVDRLTDRLQNLQGTVCENLVGFGGQLDRARMLYAMAEIGVEADPVYAIGEHGPRTIPCYEGEERWDEIAAYSTTTLKNIMAAASPPRNIATGVQLARLTRAIAGEPATLGLCIEDPDYDGMSITWPYEVSLHSFSKLLLEPGPKAQQALDELLAVRAAEAASK